MTCVLSLYYKRLDLLSFQRCVQCLGDLFKIRNHAGMLADGIVLSKGNKIIMLSGEKSPDVFGGAAECIVGRNGQHHRSPVPKMAFCCHSYRAVCNAVGQLSQSVSCAGGNDQRIQKLSWADGFYFLYG